MVRSTRLDGRAELSVQVRLVSTTVPRCSWSICPPRETSWENRLKETSQVAGERRNRTPTIL